MFSLCRYLYNNQLTGSIPSSLGNLSNLQYLCVNYQCIPNVADFVHFIDPCARCFHVFRNFVIADGYICCLFFISSCLLCRYLHYNQLSGSIPSSLGNLGNLQGMCVDCRRRCIPNAANCDCHLRCTAFICCATLCLLLIEFLLSMFCSFIMLAF